MKKICAVLTGLFLCFSSLGAENIKFKVGGSADGYNQIKLRNNSNGVYFDCEAFLLEDQDGKLIAKESLGVFHLGKIGSDDTCTLLKTIKKGMNLGVSVPEKAGKFSYVIEYKDYPLFGVIDINLIGSDSPLGKEF